MDPQIAPIANYRQYNPQVQQKSLSSLKIAAPISIVLAICSIIIGLMWYSTNGLTEYLLVAINNIVIILICTLSLVWSCSSQIINDGINNQEGYPVSSIPYIHALSSQIACAIEAGLVISLIEYKSYNDYPLVLLLQIIQILVLLYMANVSRQFNVREYGVQRLLVYGSSSIIFLFLIFAAYNLNKVIYQINYQQFQMSQSNFEIILIKIVLILLFFATIFVSFFNLRRIKIYFVTLGFFIMGICIVIACVNGLLIRKVQILKSDLQTDQGCRFAMQSISEHSLKSILDCQNKYLQLEQSPYLDCDQQQQSYEWEANNSLGCINTNCCSKVQKFVFNPINNLTIWVNLIVMVGIVQAFNAAMLSQGTFKRFKMSILGDGVIFLILLILGIAVVICYKFTPDLGVTMQHSLVKEQSLLNQITILKTPTYSNFDKQEKLVGYYNLQSCQPLKQIMLQEINLKSDKKGVILAISGTHGQFTILNNFNNNNLKVCQDNLIAKQLFPSISDSDSILIQGQITEVINFIDNNLNYCSDNPLNSDFEILIDFYDIPNSNRILQQTATKSQTNIQQQQIDKALQYFNIIITVEQSTDFSVIPNAVIEIYDGKFIGQSCQIINQLNQHLFVEQTDSNGQVFLNNLNKGNSYTVLIKKPGYKRTCSIIDLNRQDPKIKYIFRLTKDIQPHSIRVILEWTSNNLELDLYGGFKVEDHYCFTGPLSKSCGGITHTFYKKENQHIEILDIYELQPFTYTVFVKRFLKREEALKLINDQNINQQWIDSDPRITVYLHELHYQLLDFQLPPISTSQMNLVDLTWLAFQINGNESDAPILLQQLKNDITNDEIKSKTAYSKSFWPSI